LNYPKKIKALRKNKGWSQADLAIHLGVQQSTVSRWERGDTKPVGLYALPLIKLLSEGIKRGASV
jgi:DNA-binding transcriptional regulator YiaG